LAATAVRWVSTADTRLNSLALCGADGRCSEGIIFAHLEGCQGGVEDDRVWLTARTDLSGARRRVQL